MVGLVAARFEQDADANPVPVAWLDAQDLAGPRSAEEVWRRASSISGLPG